MISELLYEFSIVKISSFSSSELVGRCSVLSIEMTAIECLEMQSSLTNRVNIQVMLL